MRKVNLKDIPEQSLQSPKEEFGARYKDISVALGRDKESFDLIKRHPFDLTLGRIQFANFSLMLCYGSEANCGGISVQNLPEHSARTA
jgi:hypothetical protein